MALQKLDRRFDSDPRLDKKPQSRRIAAFSSCRRACLAAARGTKRRPRSPSGVRKRHWASPLRARRAPAVEGRLFCGGRFAMRLSLHSQQKKRTPKRGFVFCRGGRIAFPIVSDGLRRVSPRARQSCLKKSLPLSSTRMKAGKFSTSIFQTASIPSSGYSTSSTFLMLSCARIAAGPPMEPR